MYPVAAAFYLGTTKTVFGYSFKSNATKIYTEQSFTRGQSTSVLVDKNGQFYAFGRDAVEHYACLAEVNEHLGWRFFRRLQLDINNAEYTVQDFNGKTYPALEIFVMAIKYLHGRFKEHIRRCISCPIEENAILFVLTVPDAWKDGGKQFIRLAATKAGINGDQLELTFESEATAMWCNIAVNNGPILQWPGHRYIVIKQEGDNINITVNQTLPTGNAQHLHHESCGGINIQQFFEEYLDKVFGQGVLEQLHRGHLGEYLEFVDYLNSKKDFDRKLFAYGTYINLRIPVALFEMVQNRSFDEIKTAPDKIRIEVLDLQRWLEGRVTSLIDRIKQLLSQADLINIRSVLLVGDIVISEVVQDRFKERLPEFNVFALEDADCAVVQGALVCGHKAVSSSTNRAKNGKHMLPPNIVSKRTIFTRSKIPRKQFPIVAAFDFGTTYSGYAYSCEKEDDNVKANKPWHSNDSSASLSSLKTPTSVLVDSNGQFHSFGFEAEDEFARLMEEDENDGWRLFRRFKMILHNNKALSRYTTVEDIEGRPFPAMKIFAMSIKYLKEHLLKAITLQIPGMEESDIQYVLTVPAIWDVAAKQFMREAAEEGGIDSDRLLLAFESEVAALWSTRNCTRDVQQLIGSKYIVIDLGGGTADITVHERQSDGGVKVIHQPTGGAWGGVKVDEKFFQYLEEVLGKGVLEELRKKNLEDYYLLMRDFENKKRSNTIISGRFTTLRIPSSLSQIATDRHKASYNSEQTTTIKADKLRIESSAVKDWFENSVTPLIEHLKKLMIQDNIVDVRTIMLVGGFAESAYVQKRLKDGLTRINVIVPEDAGLAVVKGAVIFGQKPNAFASRVVNYTYGIEVYDDFDDNIHPAEKRRIINGQSKVENCFQIFVRANEMISVDHCVTHCIAPLASVSLISVYRSFSKNPKYVTDVGCEFLGMLMIENPENIPFNRQEKEVTFMFGNTEIFVKVRHLETGHEGKLTIDCL